MYLTDPVLFKEQAGMTMAEKIAKFFEDPISKEYPDTKLVNSTLVCIYKEFGIEQMRRTKDKVSNYVSPTKIPHIKKREFGKSAKPKKEKDTDSEESDDKISVSQD
jgi:hypothetical protein